MDTTSIKNKLIIYKNNSKLKPDTVKVIQDALLNGKKNESFKDLLDTVERELNIPVQN